MARIVPLKTPLNGDVRSVRPNLLRSLEGVNAITCPRAAGSSEAPFPSCPSSVPEAPSPHAASSSRCSCGPWPPATRSQSASAWPCGASCLCAGSGARPFFSRLALVVLAEPLQVVLGRLQELRGLGLALWRLRGPAVSGRP